MDGHGPSLEQRRGLEIGSQDDTRWTRSFQRTSSGGTEHCSRAPGKARNGGARQKGEEKGKKHERTRLTLMMVHARGEEGTN